jgi:hypothetical protein
VLLGEFTAPAGRPYISARLWIPRFDLARMVRFCVDTGSSYTMLMPNDGFAMGLDYSLLDEELDVDTVGGETTAFLETAYLTFSDEDTPTAYGYHVVLAIAPPSVEVARLPSLLGRDIINRWRIDYHPTAGQLQCDVITADEIVDLGAS